MIERVSETELRFTGQTGTQGFHTRSAAFLVRWTAGLDATLEVVAPRGTATLDCRPRNATNLIKLCTLGVRPGETVRITAKGRDALLAIYGASRALEEEPPPVGPVSSWTNLDRLRVEEWVRRLERGMPPDEALAEELLWWLKVTSKPHRSPAELAEMDRRMQVMLTNGREESA